MIYKNNDFLDIIQDILDNKTVQDLELYKHHYGSNRLEHCLAVSYYSYLICKSLHLDYVSVARAGVLHDLFLYDCECKSSKPKFHIWKHPKLALANAKELFVLNKKECDIVLKHMWPITPIPPKYLESFILTFVDKFCAFKEWCTYSKNVVSCWYLSLFLPKID